MRLECRDNRDFLAGAMFFGVGAAALFLARHYQFGSTLRMGPGFFPVLLGITLVLFGVYIMIKGLRKHERIQGNWSIRAMIMLPLATVLFGFLIERTGFIPALLVLGFGSAAAGNEFRWGEALLLTAFLTVLSVVLFIWGLGLPYSLIGPF